MKNVTRKKGNINVHTILVALSLIALAGCTQIPPESKESTKIIEPPKIIVPTKVKELPKIKEPSPIVFPIKSSV